MNPRLLLLSDLHLRPESEEVCFQVLESALKEAQIQKVYGIAFLGDFFHIRYQVPVYLINKVADWVERASTKYNLILLPGNHDQVDESGRNALEVFSKWGAQVRSEPYLDSYGLWMPYRKDNALVASLLAKYQNYTVTVFGHLPVMGALMNNTMPDTSGLTPDCFTVFKKVLLGHYHKQQAFLGGKVEYIGSPWQTRADEWGQDKGFALWDGDKLTRINKVFGKRYFRFQATDASDLKEQLKGLDGANSVIQLVMPNVKALEAAQKVLAKAGFENVVGVAKDLAITQPRYGFTKATALSEYAKTYAAEKGKEVASVEDLMSTWTELNL